jgi:transcriptional regulator with XRE-family HTH domain
VLWPFVPYCANDGAVGQPAQKTNQQRVGANVKRRRLELGISQEDLGQAAGLHATAIGRLERGEREPRLHTIITVGRALSIWPGDLLRGVK